RSVCAISNAGVPLLSRCHEPRLVASAGMPTLRKIRDIAPSATIVLARGVPMTDQHPVSRPPARAHPSDMVLAEANTLATKRTAAPGRASCACKSGAQVKIAMRPAMAAKELRSLTPRKPGPVRRQIGPAAEWSEISEGKTAFEQ